jgi:hypothetical protein
VLERGYVTFDLVVVRLGVGRAAVDRAVQDLDVIRPFAADRRIGGKVVERPGDELPVLQAGEQGTVGEAERDPEAARRRPEVSRFLGAIAAFPP